jgi:hypothetical protein
LTYGWIKDPEALEWPDDLAFRYGEVVRVKDVEVLADRTGVVAGYDNLGDGGGYRYVVHVDGERTSWVLESGFLESEGATNPGGLPMRVRPVLGDGTVVRLLDTEVTRHRGLEGELALTVGLWWTDDSEVPGGYLVRLPGEREVHTLPFGSLEVVEGRF